MKNKFNILFIALMLCSSVTFSQIKLGLGTLTAADKKYEDFAYPEAIDLYEYLVEKGDSSYHVIGRLADGYRLILEPEEAAKWYAQLVKMPEHTPTDVFNYSTVLRSLGKYKESDEELEKYSISNPDDSRVVRFKNEINYLEKLRSIVKIFNVRNLEINSEGEDFPTAFNQENLIFLSSKRDELGSKHVYSRNQEGFIDIYTVPVDTLKNDTSALKNNGVQPYSAKLNTFTHEGPLCFAADGEVVYFTRNDVKKVKLGRSSEGVTNLKIFHATKMEGEWVNVEELHFNSKEYSVGHPSITEDGLTMFFVSDMPNGTGGTDLYKVTRENKSSEWGTPINLGKNVNTEGNEMFPFISTNGKLYFSSDGHIGLGGLDVFSYSVHEENSIPKNLGYSLNSERDDFAFILNEDKQSGYFASNRSNGVGADDIYQFNVINLLEKNKEEKKVLAELGFDTLSFDYEKLDAIADNIFAISLDDLALQEDSVIKLKFTYGKLGVAYDTIIYLSLEELKAYEGKIFRINFPKDKLGMMDDVFSSVDLNVDSLLDNSKLLLRFNYNKLKMQEDSLILIDFEEISLTEDGLFGVQFLYKELEASDDQFIKLKLDDVILEEDSMVDITFKYGKLGELRDTVISVNLKDLDSLYGNLLTMNLPKEKLGLIANIVNSIELDMNNLYVDSSILVTLNYKKLKMVEDSLVELAFEDLGLLDDGSLGLQLLYEDIIKDEKGVFSFYGNIYEKGTDKKLSGVAVTFEDLNKSNSKKSYVTNVSGSFKDVRTNYDLNNPILFNIVISKAGFIERTIEFGENLEEYGDIYLDEYLQNLKITKAKKGVEIGEAANIKPIYFDVNKSTIKPKSENELAKIIKILNDMPTMKIEVGSHTDSRGRDSYNLTLSQARAKSTSNYLIKRGISPSRITMKGYGETRLKNKCEDGVDCLPEEHAINRRTEFVITDF